MALILAIPLGISNSVEVKAPVVQYSLSVNIIGSGIVTINSSTPYNPGDIVNMTAYPDAGWEFSGWSNDLSGTTNPDYLTMDSNKTVTCTFTEIPKYSLSVNIVGSGIVTINGSTPYNPGDIVNMTAYPNPGWEFSGWSNDLSGTTNPDYLTMDSNKTVTCTFTEIPKTIESCDSIGTKKDTFVLSDGVYATGSGYQFSTTYDIYLVKDVTWVDGMAIPLRIPGTTTTITSDATGNVPATLLWNSPLVAGKYDIVVDIDGDGLYHAATDALDDNDIEVTAGLFVIPEVPLGTLMASLAMITGLICYITIPKIRKKQQY